LVFCPKQIGELLNGENKAGKQIESLTHAWDDGFDKESAEESNDLIVYVVLR